MTRTEELSAALTSVRERIRAAAAAVGRDPDEIQLLPITKFFSASDVEELYRLGCREFGESRDQEAAAKVAQLNQAGHTDIRWHMVGNLQRNKAKSVANWAYSVHSVDNSRLLSALDSARRVGEKSAPLQVYLQLSLDGDTVRGGVDIADVAEIDRLCAEVVASEHVELAGLMALPPREADPDQAFRRLQQEHERVRQRYPQARRLSAGMSNDLEAAIKYGSTCVRVGTALMGQRPLTSR
ncbi:YggS family pyridoxal phosphate enzyme [Mycobacteroides immunogenum]|uniref:Pyridoxal phosphate homeostasis protein n=1 Tax=Mycobacteroides immunogenum TaxID=83262 RepID=A0A179V8A6_9MYCO|nr:YggS family pyridoxal phosphate-dependent enzyme [Mycobacteroides immunogenum]OAT67253.1 YggS family pyridoxal phosphate enzyme [Mycobacteroides immunogenum]